MKKIFIEPSAVINDMQMKDVIASSYPGDGITISDNSATPNAGTQDDPNGSDALTKSDSYEWS